MGIQHPITSEREFKEELRQREVRYTRHFEEERLPVRQNVSKDLIERHLNAPDSLVDFVHVEDDHKREKYEALFDKSRKY